MNGEGRREQAGVNEGGVMVEAAPSCGQRWFLLPQSRRWILWCWSRRRWCRAALWPSCYLLKALLVPGLTVDTISGDLPPVRDILADLGPVAIPLAPLIVRLGCSKANLVLLLSEKQKKDSLGIKWLRPRSTLPTFLLIFFYLFKEECNYLKFVSIKSLLLQHYLYSKTILYI